MKEQYTKPEITVILLEDVTLFTIARDSNETEIDDA